MRLRSGLGRLYGTFVAAAIGLVGSAAAQAGVVVSITPSQDTMIFQNNTSNSSGGSIVMFAGTNSAVSVRRSLVEFDVAASIPAGAIIENAQLTLTYGMAAGTGGSGTGNPQLFSIGIHKLLASWGEGNAQTGTGTGGVGQGAPASPGDATWSSRFYGGQSWTNPGGDFAASASASTLVGGLTYGVPFTWGSTSLMVADVQQWLNNPSSNNGWILLGDEVGRQTFRGFYTREESNPAFRPTLTVEYSLSAVPEPSSVWLALTGVFGTLTVYQFPRRLSRRFDSPEVG